MKESDPFTWKLLILLLGTLILTIPMANAGVSPKYIKINDTCIEVKARCSCSLYFDTNQYRATWRNYCPSCKKYGCLDVEIGDASWTSPEGLVYCTICDRDWCMVHGKEHVNRHPTYLRKYHKKKKPAKQKSKKEIIIEQWQQWNYLEFENV